MQVFERISEQSELRYNFIIINTHLTNYWKDMLMKRAKINAILVKSPEGFWYYWTILTQRLQ